MLNSQRKVIDVTGIMYEDDLWKRCSADLQKLEQQLDTEDVKKLEQQLDTVDVKKVVEFLPFGPDLLLLPHLKVLQILEMHNVSILKFLVELL